MIRVHDAVIPAAVCERAVAALRGEGSILVFPNEEGSPLAELSWELYSRYIHPLLEDYVEAEARLSWARSSYLPNLSRLTRESARADGAAAGSEPVPWPVADGLCLVACLNEGAPDSERVFTRQERRVRHQRGRVILFPTSWTYDYVLRAGGAELFTLAVFAAVSQSTRLYDLGPDLSHDEQHCAALLSPSRTPAPRAWLPSPPLGER